MGACRLSAEKAKVSAGPDTFKRPSWADMSADTSPKQSLHTQSKGGTARPTPRKISLSEALPQQKGQSSTLYPSCRSTPDMRSWASTPNPHGTATAVADRLPREQTSLPLASSPAHHHAAEETLTHADDPGTRDAAVFKLISGLRDAAMLDQSR